MSPKGWTVAGAAPELTTEFGDREHVFVIDRDDALERKARAVVPSQRHRLLDGQRLAVGGPNGVEIGGLGGVGADETGLGPIGVRRAGRREEADVRALRVNGLAIVLEDDVVELAALEVDRAADARRVNRDARNSPPKPPRPSRRR